MNLSGQAFRAGMVALVGRPNVGKSTFLNQVLGEAISIVTPKAQTTRDQVRGILNRPDGQMVFIDTPGIHQAREGGINEFMLQEVSRALDGPDAILYLIDPFSKPTAEEKVLESLKQADGKLWIAINKKDAVADSLKKNSERSFAWLDDWVKRVQLELEASRCHFESVHRISAETGEGVQSLVDEILATLPESPPLYPDDDSLTDRPLRFVVAEMIRKQLFMNLGDELPYSCAVEIEQFQETAQPVHISALIYVERESQKGMVIGAGGKKIKEIGIQARQEVEALLGQKIFLELRVKVSESWTSQVAKMKSLGYSLEPQGQKGRKK